MGGFPDPQTFPTTVLDDIVERLLRDEPGVALQYTPVEGIPSVREYLIERQEQTQGRRPAKEELMVTSGGMECIGLACHSLLDPGDVVAVEAPTYLGALMAFNSFEAEIEGIPMDEHGLRGRGPPGAPGGRAAPEVPLRHPRVPEPDRPHAQPRAPARARRAVPAPTAC